MLKQTDSYYYLSSLERQPIEPAANSREVRIHVGCFVGLVLIWFLNRFREQIVISQTGEWDFWEQTGVGADPLAQGIRILVFCVVFWRLLLSRQFSSLGMMLCFSVGWKGCESFFLLPAAIGSAACPAVRKSPWLAVRCVSRRGHRYGAKRCHNAAQQKSSCTTALGLVVPLSSWQRCSGQPLLSVTTEHSMMWQSVGCWVL